MAICIYTVKGGLCLCNKLDPFHINKKRLWFNQQYLVIHYQENKRNEHGKVCWTGFIPIHGWIWIQLSYAMAFDTKKVMSNAFFSIWISMLC